MKRILQTIFLTTALGLAPAWAAEPIWDGNKVNMVQQELAPGAYAFVADNAEELNKTGGAAATSGGLIVGSKGAMLIDSMLNKRLADQVLALTKEVTTKPLLYVVNTSSHGDHSYGNIYMPQDAKIVQHVNTKAYVEKHLADDKAFMIKNFGAGRGIEEITARTGDVLVETGKTLKLDLGDRTIDIIDFGFAQTGGDLFVWDPQAKAMWTGNPVIAAKPALPWLLDGHLIETLASLQKIYDFLPADAKIVPGHGVVLTRDDMKWHIDYLTAVRDQVQAAVKDGLTLEQTVEKVKMPEYRGYVLFDWVHPGLNVAAAYKDLSAK